MKLEDAFSYVGRSFSFYPSLCTSHDISTTQAVFISFVGWKLMDNNKEGWVETPRAMVLNHTGLSYREQKTIRKILIEKNLIEERYERVQHKLFVRLLLEKKPPTPSAPSEVLEAHHTQPPEALTTNPKRTSTYREQLKQHKQHYPTSVTPVSLTCDKWVSSYEEEMQRSCIKPEPKTLRALAVVLDSGITQEEFIKVSKLAFKRLKNSHITEQEKFWSKQAVSLKGICKHYENIRQEVFSQPKRSAERNQGTESNFVMKIIKV